MNENKDSDSETISIGSMSSMSFSSICSNDIKKLKENPNVKSIINENAKFNDFDWLTYRNNYSDLKHIKSKREALKHWRNHGKQENRTDKLIDKKKYENFEWKTYVNNYADLKTIDNKKDAWNHWISYGIKEGRYIEKKKKNKIEEYKDFQWKIYINSYDDLKDLNTKEKAWVHWINHGKKEGRLNPNIKEEEYENFLWENYLENYKDLEFIDNKEDAWKHWIQHGKKEGRSIEVLKQNQEEINKENVKYEDYKEELEEEYEYYKEELEEEYEDYKEELEPELEDYNDYKYENENENKNIIGEKINEEYKLQEINFENKENDTFRIIFKQDYSNYGYHLFGWEGTINYFIDNFKNKDILHNNIFFDEWIEKLLLWGDKKENKKYKKIIKKKNYKLITFIHNPPVEKWNNPKNQQIIKSETLINDNFQFNENLFSKLDTLSWKNNIIYFYTLSNEHKKYLYNKYPLYKDKLVSIYHPINLECDENELFNYNNFLKTKQIFHIGWWLRNFSSFNKLKVPPSYTKKLLLKNDFKKIWKSKFENIYNKDIIIVDELENEEYIKIFNNSCVFIDLEDGIANNIILECIKYNTPIFLKRIPSMEEYIGINYPLFFNDITELNELTKGEKFLDLVINGNEYLKKMNKKHISLDFFDKKINYDLSKLEKITNTHRLTWLCVLKTDYLYNLNQYLNYFSCQSINNELNLVLFIDETLELSNEEINKIYQVNNKEIIIYNSNNLEKEINNFIMETKTDYFLMTKLYDIYETFFSKKMVNYLDTNPTCDIAISSFKNIKDETSLNTFSKNKMFFKTDSEDDLGRITWRSKINSLLELKIDENFLEKCLIYNLNIKSASSKPLYTMNMR